MQPSPLLIEQIQNDLNALYQRLCDRKIEGELPPGAYTEWTPAQERARSAATRARMGDSDAYWKLHNGLRLALGANCWDDIRERQEEEQFYQEDAAATIRESDRDEDIRQLHGQS